MMRLVPARRVVAFAVVGILSFAFGCWGEQEGPTETKWGDVGSRLLNRVVGSIESPTRLAVAPDGAVFVSDSRLEMIVEVSPMTLQAGRGFKVQGGPLAVGATSREILVGNLALRTIEIYDARKGTLSASFGPGAVGKPTDLAVDESLRLVFVLDAAAMDVKVFDLRGRPTRTISGPGMGEAQLMQPTGIALNPGRREVMVSTYGNFGSSGSSAAIKIFDYDGNHLATVSGAGECGMMGCSGGFSTPQGLAVDGQGRIYVTDVLQARVLVYDRASLSLVTTFGGRDVGYPRLRKPLDAALGVNGELFVTSNRTRTVEVFYNAGGQP